MIFAAMVGAQTNREGLSRPLVLAGLKPIGEGEKNVGIQLSMVADDASPAWLRGFSRRQQVLLPSIENEGESLMGNSDQPSSPCDASIGSIKSALDQFTFVTQYLFFEREIRSGCGW